MWLIGLRPQMGTLSPTSTASTTTARERPVVRPPLRAPSGAAEHFERGAQGLRAVRRPGRAFFQRSEMTAGPLHVPAAPRASAQARSGLAAHFVAPLWRAPLVQSAKGKRLMEKRGIFTLRVRPRFGPTFT